MAESTGRAHDSVFEEQVAHALQALGYQVHRQVGLAGFYNDLARTLNKIPIESRSLGRIFASALFRHPSETAYGMPPNGVFTFSIYMLRGGNILRVEHHRMTLAAPISVH